MLGNNIKELMKIKKISSKELADIVDVSPTHISYVINNKRQPSLDLLEKLAAALEVSVDDLFKKDIDITTKKSNEDIEYTTVKDIKDNKNTRDKDIDTIAAHLEGKNLTPQKIKLLEQYIDALFDEDDD
ncbi:helix-turn-helix domain-containing protein [Alkaliphilus sp. MSJ-5]|uniref:Helix-turn-helix domain-containing protein n=1 Tax=Alkaliphilus flagellatus TaxID=2841507 RepID=A0ABS6G5I4_9FIRM|nr:helix-turn-helix transcriptional regulator [Alkaliphilus flagellatus]MBU5677742.1 helix-turn-helix domain-containing protein [Alkaliphilus flagellatus]